MDRRALVCGLTVSALNWPMVAEGQPAGKVWRVAFLNDETGGSPPAALFDAFRQGLRELGWIEGRNIVIDYRSARSIDERPATVAEVLTLKPDVIVAIAPAAFTMSPTPTSPPAPGWTPVHGVPIVFLAVSDPVGAKMIASLARPGGTMTGLSYQSLELNTKRLQLLQEAVPSLRRVGVLVNPFHPLRDRIAREIEDGARSRGLELRFVPMSPPDSPQKLDAAFETVSREGASAVIGLQGPHFYRDRRQLAELALKHRLPSIFEFVENAVAGALLGYGPSLIDIFRRGASHVDRILRGMKPADLPVEQPTKFELVVNLKTAKALSLTIPPSVLLRADHVIE